jgi:ring-1,2-phenylacetyl-CoA epoxidase subunit PaaD
LSVERAWDVLAQLPDPEIPVISLTELGIVRDIRIADDGIEVVVTPTYSGCPATEVIAQSIEQALRDAGAGAVRIRQSLAPAWSTDWIDAGARQKLADYGIAPPLAAGGSAQKTVNFMPKVACPRCASRDTERLSQFGSTACKALYRCRACREPFEYFKPL